MDDSPTKVEKFSQKVSSRVFEESWEHCSSLVYFQKRFYCLEKGLKRVEYFQQKVVFHSKTVEKNSNFVSFFELRKHIKIRTF